MGEVIDSALVELGIENNLTGPLAAAMEEARAEIDALGHKKAVIKVKAETDQAMADLKAMEAELKALSEAEKQHAKDVKKAQTSYDHNLAAKRLNDTAYEAAGLRDDIKVQKSYIQTLQDKQRVVKATSAIITETQREEARATREATAAARDQAAADRDRAKESELARTATLRSAQALTKAAQLQKQYASAQKNSDALTKAYNRAQGSDRVRVGVDAAAAYRQMEELREKLTLMGMKPIDIHAKLDQSDTSGIKNKLIGLFGGRDGITGGDSNRALRDVANDIEGVAEKAGKARINIGPMTTSLKGLAAGSLVLAPVISGLIGTIGALISVTGAGIGGAVGVGGAALTGFGMAALGVTAAVKPFITQVGKARQYQAAYNAVVAKYGENSKQAVAAQKVLNHEMSTVPKAAREAVEGFHDLSNEWTRLMAKTNATKDIGNVIGSAFKTARSDMHWFAADTGKTMDGLSKGWQGWMAQLRSPAMSSALNNIFSKFASSIPNIMSGLGHLGSAFAQMFSSFANYFPSLSHGFDNWAKHIDDAATKSHGFASGVKTMVGAMRTLGHFAEATGRFLITFFKAGVGPGEGLLNGMTKGLNNLSKAMNTVSGQTRLQNYFSRSVGTVKTLWGMLAGLGSAFAQFGQALAPIAGVMLSVLSAFTSLISALVGFAPLQWAVGFVAAVALIGKFTAGLREASGLLKKLALDTIKFGKGVLAGDGIKNAFKNAFGSSKLSGAEIAAAIEEASTAGAAEYEAAISGASSAGAAEYAAAIRGAGAAAAAEEAGAMEAGGAATAAETAGAGAAVGVAETGAGVAAGAEIAAVEPEVASLGAAFAALAPEIAFPLAGIAALGAAFIALGHQTDPAVQAEKDLRTARAANTASARGSKGIAGSVADTTMPTVSGPNWKASDQDAVNKAAADYYKILAQGKGNTEAGQAALSTYNQALEDQRTDLQNTQQFQQQVQKQVKDQTNFQANQQLKAQKAVTDAQKQLNKVNQEAVNNAGEARDKMKDVQKATDALAGARKALTAIEQRQNTVANQQATELLNQHRNLNGMIPIADKYAQSVGSMTRQLAAAGPVGARALDQLTKIPDPQKVVAISNAFKQLTNATDKTKAIKIIADTSNPTKAIAQLNALVIHEKVVKVTSNVGQAVSQVAKLQGIKLTPKEQKILATGSPAAIAQVAKLAGIKLPPKTLQILANAQKAIAAHNEVKALGDVKKVLTIIGKAEGAKAAHSAVKALGNVAKKLTISGNNSDAMGKAHQVQAVKIATKVATVIGNVGQALGAIGAVIGALGAVQSKTVTITTVYNKVFHGGTGPGGPGAASGGISTYPQKVHPALAATQARAARVAAARPVTQTQGGRYSNPQFLVGEENKPEYVIATNPAYRQKNVAYLKQAANEFGLHIEGYATGGKPGALTQPGKAKKLTQKKVKHPKFKNSVYDLPAKDRIGGVGDEDISEALTKWQGFVTTDKSNMKTLNNAISRDQADIKKYKRVLNGEPAKKQTTTQKADLKKAQDDLKKQQAAKAKLTSKMKRDTGTTNRLKGIYNLAEQDIATFDNLESDIGVMGNMMDAAAADPSDKSTGFNPSSGKVETHTWDEWRKLEETLRKKHTKMLKDAVDNVKKIFKKDRDANPVDLKFLKTLEAAYGQSIADDAALDSAVDPNAPTPAEPNTPETMADFIKLIGQTGTESRLEYQYAADTVAAGPNPSAPTAAMLADVNSLIGFYTGVLGQAQGWKNPTFTPPSTDYSLLTEIENAISGYQGDIPGPDSTSADSTTTDVTGPTQAQLTSTALSQLYSNYGGNAGAIYVGTASGGLAAAAMGMTPTDMVDALAGGQVASDALAGSARTEAVGRAPVAAPAQQAPSVQEGHTVNNYFQEPPKNPHTWSQGIKWELGALA